MIQVRQNVFETNSSSVHSLTFVKVKDTDIDIKSIVGNKVVFGKENHDWYRFGDGIHTITPKMGYQERIDFIWNLVWGNYDHYGNSLNIREYAMFKKRFTELFNKYGVDVEFNEDLNYESCYYDEPLVIGLIREFSNVDSNEIDYTDMLGFIFSKHIDLYEFADDCYIPDDSELYKYISKFPDAIHKEDVYDVYDRC